MQIVGDRGEQRVRQLIRRHRLRALHAFLAVDAKAQFDLVVRETEARLLRRGQRAAVERDTHCADRIGRTARNRRHFRERLARRSRRARDLVHEHSPRNAAPPPALDGVAQRHVVGHHDDFDGNPFGARQLGGEAEVQAVARVVLDDQQRSVRSRRRANRGEHGVRRRRREHLAAHGGCQHAFADIARVRRLVAAAAARNDRDAPRMRLRQIAPHDDVRVAQQRGVGREHRETFEHLAHDTRRIVQQLFHGLEPR